MNWEAVGAMAELAGAIGVILSLIYLALQIRQNTRSLQGSTFQSMHDSAVQRLLAVADNDNLADRYLKGMQDPSSLHGREQLHFDQFLQAMLRGFENYYYQYRKGLLEEDLWVVTGRRFVLVCHLLASSPGGLGPGRPSVETSWN